MFSPTTHIYARSIFTIIQKCYYHGKLLLPVRFYPAVTHLLGQWRIRRGEGRWGHVSAKLTNCRLRQFKRRISGIAEIICKIMIDFPTTNSNIVKFDAMSSLRYTLLLLFQCSFILVPLSLVCAPGQVVRPRDLYPYAGCWIHD